MHSLRNWIVELSPFHMVWVTYCKLQMGKFSSCNS